MKICVNASEIASICGMHRYKPKELALVEVWMKNFRSESKDVRMSNKQVIAKKAEALPFDVIQTLANDNISFGSKNNTVLTKLKTLQTNANGIPSDPALAGRLMAEVLTERAQLVATTYNTDALDKNLSAVLSPSLLSDYTGMKQCAIGIANETQDLARYERLTG